MRLALKTTIDVHLKHIQKCVEETPDLAAEVIELIENCKEAIQSALGSDPYKPGDEPTLVPVDMSRDVHEVARRLSEIQKITLRSDNREFAPEILEKLEACRTEIQALLTKINYKGLDHVLAEKFNKDIGPSAMIAMERELFIELGDIVKVVKKEGQGPQLVAYRKVDLPSGINKTKILKLLAEKLNLGEASTGKTKTAGPDLVKDLNDQEFAEAIAYLTKRIKELPLIIEDRMASESRVYHRNKETKGIKDSYTGTLRVLSQAYGRLMQKLILAGLADTEIFRELTAKSEEFMAKYKLT